MKIKKFNIKKFLNKLIPKTKDQKHLEYLREEVKNGNLLHVDDGIKNGE
jgi:hypothetical protein